MRRTTIAALTLIAVGGAVALPALAQGHDSIFGSFFSRTPGSAQTVVSEASRDGQVRASDAREREARDMRRGYWERERARLAEQTANRTVEATTR